MKLLIIQCIIVLTSIHTLVMSNPVRTPSPEEGDNWEGDMIPNPNSLLKGAFQKTSYSATLWPNGEVPYYIDAASKYSKSEIRSIESAMRHIETETTIDDKQVIKFIKLDNSSYIGSGKAYRNGIRIFRGDGCYSYIGLIRSFTVQDVSIGNGCQQLGTVAHELLHALGFGHEQSRFDRDEYVTIKWENVIEGHENNFEKFSKSQNGLTEFPYDLGSIMHYGKDYFSKNGDPTIVPVKSGVSIGNRYYLSRQDAYEVIAAYGAKGVNSLLALLNNNGQTTKATSLEPTTTAGPTTRTPSRTSVRTTINNKASKQSTINYVD